MFVAAGVIFANASYTRVNSTATTEVFNSVLSKEQINEWTYLKRGDKLRIAEVLLRVLWRTEKRSSAGSQNCRIVAAKVDAGPDKQVAIS